jgi:hypothetical protein
MRVGTPRRKHTGREVSPSTTSPASSSAVTFLKWKRRLAPGSPSTDQLRESHPQWTEESENSKKSNYKKKLSLTVGCNNYAGNVVARK